MTQRFDEIDRELEALAALTEEVTEVSARVAIASRPPLPVIDDELRALADGTELQSAPLPPAWSPAPALASAPPSVPAPGSMPAPAPMPAPASVPAPAPESEPSPALTPSGRPILSADDLFSDEDFVDSPAGDVPLVDEKTLVEGKDTEPPNVPSAPETDTPLANGFFDTDAEWGRDPTSIFTEEELDAIREGSMAPPPVAAVPSAPTAPAAPTDPLEDVLDADDFDLLVDERSMGDEAEAPLHADLDKPSESNPPTAKKSLLKKLFG